MSSLALNMIVAAGESEILDRCLDSFDAREFFDEIVIVNTSNDGKIDEVAKTYDAKLIRRIWDDDFSAARNAALDNTESDYIMWLDSDDVCLEQFQHKIKNVRKVITDNNRGVEAFFFPYCVQLDEHLNSTISFLRERIFKRCSLFRWEFPVHERICRDWTNVKRGIMPEFQITHLPMKPQETSAERNLRILRKYLDSEEGRYADPQLRFFYGRDLMMSSDVEGGIAKLDTIINELDSDDMTLYMASWYCMMWFAYGGHEARPASDAFNKDNEVLIEQYARLSIAFSNSYAEPYVVLGDLYAQRGMLLEAKRLYETALRKKINTGGIQAEPYYEELPAERLSKLHIIDGDYDRALFYNGRALKHNDTNSKLLNDRRFILQHEEGDLNERYSQNKTA